MSDLYFWNEWRKPYRIIYLILLLLFGLAVLGLLYAVIWGQQLPFSWEVVNRYAPLELPLKAIDFYLSEITPKVEHYVLEQTFAASPIELFPQVYAGLAIISLLLISILIAILTAFPRFWYLMGMTLVAFIFVGLRLEQIMLFNSTENVGLYIALALYFPLSFYFHSINKIVPLYNRILGFLGVSLAFCIIVYCFSNVTAPFLYIGTYGVLVPIALSFIFILLISHDIISGFLYLVTGGTASVSKNSLLHFSAITIIFLGWLLITYFHNINVLDWDILYVHPAALLAISAIAGIYGFRERCGAVYAFLPFQPYGAILYISLAIISLSTVGGFYLVANDPMLGMFEDFIIFSHMGVGLMFFIYIIANFAGVLKKNLNVFRIQYKPLNLPYFITTIGGIVLIVVLVAKSLMYPYHQAFAGYYNGLGDLFALDKQLFLSEQYYKLGRSYDATNHRSNYSLASLAVKQGDEGAALIYFDDALARFPTAHAFINVANIYREKGRFFDALFVLNEGLQQFPENPYMQNNLASLFAKTSVLDSAAFYLDKARAAKDTEDVAEVNLMKLYAASGIALDRDSLVQSLSRAANQALVNNTLVYLNANQQVLPPLDELGVKVARSNLGPEEFTFWHEYALNQVLHHSAFPLDSLLHDIAFDSSNYAFHTELLFIAGISEYYGYKVGQAFETFGALKMNASSRTGYFNYLMGLWALEQGAYHLAVDYLSAAQNEGFDQGAYPMALAMTFAGSVEDARPFWERAIKEGEGVSKASAGLVLQWLDVAENSQGKNDSTALLNVLFSRSARVPDLLEMASAIGDNALQVDAWLIILEKALEADNLTGVNSLIELLERRETDGAQQQKFSQLRFRYWLKTNQVDKVQNFMDDPSAVEDFIGSPEMLLYEAKSAETAGNEQKAANCYKQLETMNPFFEMGVIDAAEFVKKNSGDNEQAYKILLDALKTNPYSTSLQKAYIMQSLELNLTSYAQKNLQNLEKIMTASDFQEFLAQYRQKLDSLEQLHAQWE